MVKNRTKLLLSNVLVYGFGGVIAKIIPLIMVPIVTRLMPDTFSYGISDLCTTIISLFSAIAVMGMYDATFRMFFDKDDEDFKKSICSSSLIFTLINSLFVFLLMIILNKQISLLFFKDNKFGNLVILCGVSVMAGSTNTIISSPTRMENKKGLYLLGNIMSPIIAYSIAIPLIIMGHYLIALPLATMLSSIAIEVTFAILNRKWFSIRRINWKYIKNMLMIALPLLPNFLIYWVFNSSDRVMISNLIGPEYSGIYAVGAKIGHISQIIYLAFAGGWQFFAFSIMKDKDNVGVISKVFELLVLAAFVTTLLGTSICKIGVELLFKSDYWPSYICIPYLYLAPLLLMLFQIGSNQFLVIKKTWPNVLILGFGAIVNLVLNFVLIPAIGIEGASIATLIGYIISITLCILVLLKLHLIKLNWRFYVGLFLFAASLAIMRLNSFAIYYINVPLAICCSIVMLFFYHKDIVRVFKNVFKRNDCTSSVQDENKGEEGF